jgi:hypothetical protein
MNFNKNIAVEYFISDPKNHDLKNFIISKIGEIKIFTNIILNYVPLLLKWHFNVVLRKKGIVYKFDAYFYAINTLDCWRCLKDLIINKHFDILTYEIFNDNIKICDNTIYTEFNNSFTYNCDIIIANCKEVTNRIDITHHKYFNNISNLNELNKYLNDYNSFYRTDRKCFYNLKTGLIDNLDSNNTLKNIIIEESKLNNYLIVDNLSLFIDRVIRFKKIFKKCFIKKKNLFIINKKNRLPNYIYSELAKNLKVRFIKT